LAYVDWSAQEFAILAGLSGDEQLIKAYENSDPYMAFAKDAKLAPPNATKQSHPEIRNACKRLLLGVPYGMTPQGLAKAVKIPLADAREIYARHRATYCRFWLWGQMIVSPRRNSPERFTRNLAGNDELRPVLKVVP
jgi:DNA polymerase-1